MKNQEKILRTQHFTRPNTKLSPCWKYKEKSCNEAFLHQKIAKDFNCQVPILYTGMHLESLDLEDLPICNKTVTLHMMSMDTKDSNCSKSIPCEHTGEFFLWFWLAHILFPESSWHRITVLLTFFKAELFHKMTNLFQITKIFHSEFFCMKKICTVPAPTKPALEY